MARLKLTILGCGASPGVPRIDGDWGACDPAEPRNRRSRCSVLFERFEPSAPRPTRVLIDTGPDLRAQLLSVGVDALDGVVYTHSHADHLHGIDDLRAYALISRRLLEIHADDATYERIEAAFGYCFHTPPGSVYPPILHRTRIVAGTPFVIDGPGGPMRIEPFRQIHGDIDTLGLRIGGIAYSCDISDVPVESLAALAGIDVWVLDALRHKTHPSHFSVGEAVDWIGRIKPRRAYLTHMHADLDYRTTLAALPEGVEPAYDGLEVESTVT